MEMCSSVLKSRGMADWVFETQKIKSLNADFPLSDDEP